MRPATSAAKRCQSAGRNTYQYDSYNRLTSVTWANEVYQGSTVAQVLRTYYYDTNPLNSTFSQYSLGRLTAVQYANVAPYSYAPSAPGGAVQLVDMYSYTAPTAPGAGLPAAKRLQVNQALAWETTPGGYPASANASINLDSTYTYNNEGKLTSITYPSTTNNIFASNGLPSGIGSYPGASYNYSYDGMYRLSGMTTSAGAAVVSGVSYNAANQLLGMTYNGIGETRGYNVLNQLTSIAAGSTENLTYNYPTGTNNGKISSMYNAVSGETITYAYDSLNRLATAAGSGWGEAYTFDGFGNLNDKTVTSGSGPSLSMPANPATNRTGATDANGNMLSSVNGGAGYDAENRISAVYSTPNLEYGYDAQNRRTFLWPKTYDTFPSSDGGNPTGYSVVLYSPTGQKLGTYQINDYNTSTTNYVALSICSTLMSSDQYFGGRRLAVIDQLGSAGTYYPWGENKGTTSPQNTWGFGTYWEDSATGLDYANNRYYSNAYGRFMTPDPYQGNTGGAGNPNDPQSWNRYAYTRGDPVNRFDPGGTCDQSADGNHSVTVCDTADTVDTYSISGLGSYNQWVTAGVNDAVAIASIAAAAAVEQYQFSVALAAFQNAASQIEGTGSFSAQCDKDLAAVGASPAALQAAASTADFQNGIGSSATVASLYSGAATPIVGQLGANSPGTIGQVFAGSPLGVVAEAQLGGNNIYLNGPLISGLLNGTYQLTGGAAFNVTAVVMHELLHNLTGLTDPEIQTDLGLTQSAVTDNISQKLATDCLK